MKSKHSIINKHGILYQQQKSKFLGLWKSLTADRSNTSSQSGELECVAYLTVPSQSARLYAAEIAMESHTITNDPLCPTVGSLQYRYTVFEPILV